MLGCMAAQGMAYCVCHAAGSNAQPAKDGRQVTLQTDRLAAFCQPLLPVCGYVGMGPFQAWRVLQMRVMCDGILETMQRYDYEGKLEHCFTAHPKIDPDSGEAFKQPGAPGTCRSSSTVQHAAAAACMSGSCMARCTSGGGADPWSSSLAVYTWAPARCLFHAQVA